MWARLYSEVWYQDSGGVVKATGGRLASSETSRFSQQVSDLIPELSRIRIPSNPSAVFPLDADG
jgi:hypothetical protein